jgi:hypothetical protein
VLSIVDMGERDGGRKTMGEIYGKKRRKQGEEKKGKKGGEEKKRERSKSRIIFTLVSIDLSLSQHN